MKLIKFEESKKNEDVIRLNTRIDDYGNYVVFACNANGKQLLHGNILFITPYGQLRRCPACDVPGIQVDDHGRILLDE